MKYGPRQKVMTTHREENESRIKSDAGDRGKLKHTLSTFIDPLGPTGLSTGLVNIANGLVPPDNVDVDNALEIGTQQMRQFESSWPATFHETLAKKVTTMATNRKCGKGDDTQVCDTKLVFTRVTGLQQSCNIDIKEIHKCELSSVPQALFDGNADMRSQTKATMKSKLQVEISNRGMSPPDAMIIDGCALLWCVNWPSTGTAQDFTKNFMGRLSYYVQRSSAYLVFDRYPPTSTKVASRSNHAGKDVSRKHVLTLHKPLPSQKVVLECHPQ